MKKLFIPALILLTTLAGCRSGRSQQAASPYPEGYQPYTGEPQAQTEKDRATPVSAPGTVQPVARDTSFPRKPKAEPKEITFLELPPEKFETSSQELSFKLDILSRRLSKELTDPNHTMVVATFVDLDRLNRSSTMGRYLAEQLMDRMTRQGCRVVEVRESKKLMVRPNVGEHGLTEEFEEMMNAYRASVLIMGTYKKVGEIVTVTARAVHYGSQTVLASGSLELKVDNDDKFIQAMFDNALERVGDAEPAYEGLK